MTDIDKIPSISPAEIAALRSQNILTITDLWQRVGKDFNQGINSLAEQTNIEPKRLVELLKSQALLESESRGASWPARHWLELALLALLLLVLGLFLYARSTAALSWSAPPIGWGQPALVLQVVASHDLPAYYRITPQDLASAVRPEQSGGIRDQAEALGSFTLREVVSGSVLLSDWLSTPIAAPTDEYALVSLPVASHMLKLVKPGEPASFMVAPRRPGTDCQTGTTLFDGLILAVQDEQEGASLVVAIPSSQLDALRLCLGFADVVVVR
jgi:SAF domain